MEEQLIIQKLDAGYQNGKPVLEDFSLSIEEGQRIGIVGQNGSGKSTIAKAIMGIAPFVTGEIRWYGKDILKIPIHKKSELGIAYSMQGGRVFSNLSVRENIKFALLHQKQKTIDSTINELSELNIALFNSSRIHLPAANLSGGERHILGFLMIILSNPYMKLLIADEPSAGIAYKVQIDLLKIIKSTIENKNISLILIEQNIEFLNQLTNNIINISKNK